MADNQADSAASRRNFLARGWRNIRDAGARRLVGTLALLMLACVFARFSWNLPVLSDAERSLYDLRAYSSARQVDQDDRLRIIVYDDQTLIDARKRSPLDRGLLAKALRNLDAMGAKAIGIDILFDQPQDEDEDLIAALRGMKTPVFAAYANVAANRADITYRQQQFLDSFIARLKGSKAAPTSIRLDYANGVARAWPSIEKGLPPVMSRSMLEATDPGQLAKFDGYTGAIVYRLPKSDDRPVYQSLRIDLFADPALAPAFADQIRGRYLLLGGDIIDVDRVETTFTSVTGETAPGIQVHAAMLAQMLDGQVPKRTSGWALSLMALSVIAAAALTSLLEMKVLKLLPFVAAQLALFGGLPVLQQYRGIDTQNLPALGWALGWIIAFAAVGAAARASGAEQRRFAYAALGKYLPRDIAEEIIEHPELLALHGKKQSIYILFSDLEGFTKLSHDLEPEMVARLLNRYLETMSQVVLDHGGVIDKFVGDAVVAFWGAPISRPDDGLRAAKAGYAMWQAGEEFRRSVGNDVPPIGRTRVGMHYGPAVIGNFGGENRIQYTALGDSMNTASRLESANKSLDSSAMASGDFAERSGLDWWRPMGKVVLRGRKRAIDLFEPAPDFPAADRAGLAEALAGLAKDRKQAVSRIETIAAKYPFDTALQNLVFRSRNLDKDGAYVLD